jgi:hypothetical protein
LSEALADLSTRNHLHLDNVRALLGIDQLARSLADALSGEYAMGDAQPQESVAWQSAFELSRSFAFGMRCNLRRLCRAGLSTVLLRLFQHRQVDFLLRPFVSVRRLSDCWIELHAAFLHCESADLLRQPLVSRRNDEGRGEESSLEREYIHLLLVELLNVGQLSPYDAFWVSRQIPRWRTVLSLQSQDARAPVQPAEHRFVFDLDNAEGLVRPARSSTGNHRYLDLAPMLALIRDEIALLRDPAGPLDDSAPIRRGRQLKLLRKVHAICQPNLERVIRRGDRLPVVSALKVIVGLPHITRMLRHERRKNERGVVTVPAAEADEQNCERNDPGPTFGLRSRRQAGARGGKRRIRRAAPGVAAQGLQRVRLQIAWKDREPEPSAAGHPARVSRRRQSALDVGCRASFQETNRRRVDIGVEYVGEILCTLTEPIPRPDEGSRTRRAGSARPLSSGS